MLYYGGWCNYTHSMQHVDLDSHFTGDRANQSEQFYSVNDNGISSSMDRILIHNSKHIDVHCTKT